MTLEIKYQTRVEDGFYGAGGNLLVYKNIDNWFNQKIIFRILQNQSLEMIITNLLMVTR